MTSFLNHVAVRVPGAGTTARTFDPANPTAGGAVVAAGTAFTPTAGRYLVAVIATNFTATTPTGWTADTSATGVKGYAYLMHKTAAGADTMAWTTAIAGQLSTVDVYEFAAGTTMGTPVTSIAAASGAAGPSITGLTGLPWVGNIVVEAVASSISATHVWDTGVEAVDSPYPNASGHAYSLMYQENWASSSSSRTVTESNADQGNRITFALTIPSAAAAAGAASFSFTAAGTAGGIQAAAGTASFAFTASGGTKAALLGNRIPLYCSSDFETDTAGWNAAAGVLSRDSVNPYAGSWSAKIVDTGGIGYTNFYSPFGTGAIQVTPGETIDFSAACRVSNPVDQAIATITFYTFGGVNLGQVNGSYTAGLGWQRTSGSTVVPATAFYGIIQIYCLPSSPGDAMWVDDVRLYRTPTTAASFAFTATGGAKAPAAGAASIAFSASGGALRAALAGGASISFSASGGFRAVAAGSAHFDFTGELVPHIRARDAFHQVPADPAPRQVPADPVPSVPEQITFRSATYPA